MLRSVYGAFGTLVLLGAATAGFASASMPVLAVTTSDVVLTFTLDAAGQSLTVATPVAVPVPTRVSNPAADTSAWLAERGVAGAAPVAEAAPAGPLYESHGGTLSLVGVASLLPDNGLTVTATPTSTSTFATMVWLNDYTLHAAGLAPEGRLDKLESLDAAALGAVHGDAAGALAPQRLAYVDGATPEARLPYDPVLAAPATAPSEPAEGSGAVTASTAATSAATSADTFARARTAAFAAAAVALPGLLGWALYHRIRGHGTLDNATRKRVFEAVASNPGAGVQEVARAVGVSYSTASYHLERLCDARMLVLSAQGSKLRYYKNGGLFSEEERKLLPLLKNAEAMRLLNTILERPGTYRAEIAAAMGVTPTTVNWHLKRLVDAGLIQEVRQGRNAFLSVDRARLAALVTPLLPKLEEAQDATAATARRIVLGAPAGPAPPMPA